MSEYLNKQDILNAINDVMNDRTILHKFRALRKKINRIATADVVAVKHGKWEEELIEGGNGVAEVKSVCSLCGKTNKHYMPPFCPHCGARMGV